MEVWQTFNLRCLNGIDEIHVLLLAFKGADRVSGVLAIQVGLVATDYAPTKLA